MVRWYVIVSAALMNSACLQPQLSACGDQYCFGETTCVAKTYCATAEQIDRCTGITDGEMCTIDNVVGQCDLGVCLPTGCGNGATDLDEVCDDRNQTSGDGCRADCRKVEVCRDAVVDTGEGCDDGNDNPADGCDACVGSSAPRRCERRGRRHWRGPDDLRWPSGPHVPRERDAVLDRTRDH